MLASLQNADEVLFVDTKGNGLVDLGIFGPLPASVYLTDK